RVRVALLGVPVADDPAAAAAGLEARRAGRVPVLGTHTLVRRAVLQPARGAHAGVLVTRRLPVHATLGEALLRAEGLGADRAATRSVDLSRRWLKRSRSKSPGSRAATGFAAAASASSAGSTRPASRSWNAPARSSSTLAPVDKSYTSLSTTASSTPAPARSTTRANSRPMGCTARRFSLARALPSRTGIASSTRRGSPATAGAIRPNDRRA